jgi:hypothetical protein
MTELNNMQIELAKRLKELGIKQHGDGPTIKEGVITNLDGTEERFYDAYVPTSEELGVMLPTILGENYVFTTYKMEDNGWFVDYTDMTPDPEKIGHPFMFTDPDGVDHTVCQSGKTEAEARAKVLVFLLEHSLMRKP